MSDEIATHRGARALVEMVLRASHPPARIVPNGHDYDSVANAGTMRVMWRDGPHEHYGAVRYELPCDERRLRHQVAALRDGKSYLHLR